MHSTCVNSDSLEVIAVAGRRGSLGIMSYVVKREKKEGKEY